MNFESTTASVPKDFRGLRILLVDSDATSLLNVASTLEEHSFRVTAVEKATAALSILQERIDEFDLVMVDMNMPEMDCFEFMSSTQLIKDIPITLMTSVINTDMMKGARENGAYIVLIKPISTKKLLNVWQYVLIHGKRKESGKPEHNDVEVMDKQSGADKKIQDRKGKGIVNATATYQDQAEGTMTLEKRENTRRRMEWTLDLEKKFTSAVCELGERARPKLILENMNVPDLTQTQVSNYLQKYRARKRQAQYVQQASSSILNQSNIMSQMPPPLVPVSQSQDGVNEGWLQPLNIENTVGNFVSVSQGLSFPGNRHHFNTINHFADDAHQFNVLNSSEVPVNFTEPLQEAYIPQPPAVPTLVPPNDLLSGLNDRSRDPEVGHFNGKIAANQMRIFYDWLEKAARSTSSTQDNISTRNQNP